MSPAQRRVLQRAVLPARQQARGAALLLALLTVSLVSLVAAQAFWQQWRGMEIEQADRSRLQARWLLGGSLDWARARLRDDGQRNSRVDHASETWGQPIVQMPLSQFLAGAQTADAALPQATLSMQLTDAQGKLNALNLLEGQNLSPLWLQAFTTLFELLALPPEQLETLGQNLRAASVALNAADGPAGAAGAAGAAASAALLPQQLAQLTWLGLAPETLAALQPHVSLLPTRTPVNLNSASAEVLRAVVPGLTRVDAQRWLALRQFKLLQSVGEAPLGGALAEGQYSVNSRFYELRSEVKMGALSVAENVLLQRDGAEVRTLWRRGTEPVLSAATPP